MSLHTQPEVYNEPSDTIYHLFNKDEIFDNLALYTMKNLAIHLLQNEKLSLGYLFQGDEIYAIQNSFRSPLPPSVIKILVEMININLIIYEYKPEERKFTS